MPKLFFYAAQVILFQHMLFIISKSLLQCLLTQNFVFNDKFYEILWQSCSNCDQKLLSFSIIWGIFLELIKRLVGYLVINTYIVQSISHNSIVVVQNLTSNGFCVANIVLLLRDVYLLSSGCFCDGKYSYNDHRKFSGTHSTMQYSSCMY